MKYLLLIIFLSCSQTPSKNPDRIHSPKTKHTKTYKEMNEKERLEHDYKALKDKNKYLQDKLRFQQQLGKEELKRVELKLELKCERKDFDSCFELGKFYQEQKKEYKLNKVWKDNCKINLHIESCYHYGLLKQKKKSWNDALEAFETSCLENHAMSCNNLAYAHYQKRNIEGTRTFFKKACELKLKEACSNLAKLESSKNRHKEALAAYEAACVLGSDNDCEQIKINNEKVKEKQNAEFIMGCEQNIAVYCFNLGHNLFYLDKKLDSLEAFKKACALEDNLSCGYFAAISRNQKLFTEISKEFTSDCNGGNSHQCYYLSALYAFNGDKIAAFNNLKKAIDLGFDDFKSIDNAPEFNSIRFNEDFLELTGKNIVQSYEKLEDVPTEMKN